MLKRLALLALIVSLAGIPSRADQKIPERSKPAQPSNPDKRGTNESPLVVETRAADSKEEAAKEAARDADQERTNRWSIRLTWAIAICAGLQFCGIVAQVYVYCRQTKLMHGLLRGTIKAAKATEDAVVAANSSRTLAEDTAKRQLRAYMCVSKAYAIIHDGAGVEFYVRFRNSGQTPAYKFGGIQRSGISVHPIPDTFVRVLPSPKSRGMTGSGDVYHVRFWTNPAIQLSTDELIKVISGDQVLFMSGIYTYEDIFGENHTLHIQQIAGGPTRVRRTKLKDKPGQVSITLYNDEVGNYEETQQPQQQAN